MVNKLLNDAHAGSEELVPNSPRCLAVVTSVDGAPSVPTTASQPPWAGDYASPFVGQSVAEVANQVHGAAYLVILDKRSIEDDTAILAAARQPGGGGGGVQTVRVTFRSAQLLPTALEVASLGFTEVQDIANKSGGVYGASRGNPPPQRGGPAPRKRLGGD